MSALQDWDFWISILENGYKHYVINDILFFYRVRTGSMFTNTKKPNNYSKIYRDIVQNHILSFKENIIDILNYYSRRKMELESLISTYKNSNSSLIKKVASLESQLLELRAGVNWLEGQRDSWEKAAEELRTGNAWLEGQRVAWEKAVVELQSGNAWLEEQRTAWENATTELKVGNAWLEEQRAAWEKTADELKTGNSRLIEQVTSLEKKVGELNGQNEEKDKIITSLQEEIALLEKKIPFYRRRKK